MTLQIPVGYGELLFRFRLDGDHEAMVTTLGFKSEAAMDSQDDLMASAAWAIETFETNLFPGGASMFTTWNFDGYQVTVNSSDGGLVTAEVPHPVAGAASGGTPPNNTAMLIRKVTGLGGRAHRGRFYMPPFNLDEENVNNYGVLATPFLTLMQSAYTDWLADMVAGDGGVGKCFPCVLHTDPLVDPDLITAFVVQAKVATQRRRLRP